MTWWRWCSATWVPCPSTKSRAFASTHPPPPPFSQSTVFFHATGCTQAHLRCSVCHRVAHIEHLGRLTWFKTLHVWCRGLSVIHVMATSLNVAHCKLVLPRLPVMRPPAASHIDILLCMPHGFEGIRLVGLTCQSRAHMHTHKQAPPCDHAAGEVYCDAGLGRHEGRTACTCRHNIMFRVRLGVGRLLRWRLLPWYILFWLGLGAPQPHQASLPS